MVALLYVDDYGGYTPFRWAGSVAGSPTWYYYLYPYLGIVPPVPIGSVAQMHKVMVCPGQPQIADTANQIGSLYSINGYISASWGTAPFRLADVKRPDMTVFFFVADRDYSIPTAR